MMASDKNKAANGPITREQHNAETIKKKRRSIDNDVASYRDVKDREFRAFEAFLTRNPAHPSVAEAEAHVKSLKMTRPWHKEHKPRLIPLWEKPKKRTDEEIIAKGHVGAIGTGVLGPEEEAAYLRLYARQDAEAKRREELEKRGEGHEREKELQGVITPDYLSSFRIEEGGASKENEATNQFEVAPLKVTKGKGGSATKAKDADKTAKATPDPVQRHDAEKAAKAQLDRVQVQLDIATARSAAAPVLSASAEDHPPPMISPPATPARPLSSSVPPDTQHDHNRHRSSSRSDGSIDGRRSSFKDPSQPKSPKKVQFSIDDTVVSPSSSPLASRPSAASGSNLPERFEVVKRKQESKSSTNGPRNEATVNYATPAIRELATARMNSMTMSFHAQRDHDYAVSVAGGEDFDVVDTEDDVFAFDEDISARKKEENGDGEVVEDDIEETEIGPPLTGSSPHAGSLPIEIRMPMRRGRGIDDG